LYITALNVKPGEGFSAKNVSSDIIEYRKDPSGEYIVATR